MFDFYRFRCRKECRTLDGSPAAGEGAGLDDAGLDRLRHALRSTLAGLPVDDGHRGHIPFTPGAKDLLDRSLALSVEHGRDHVSERDLLLAALSHPPVAAELAAGGADVEGMRAVIDAVTGAPDDTRPGPHRPRPERG